MSSLDLSVLTFALSSWLDGSAQLRRSLIFLPLGIGGHHEQTGSASFSSRRVHPGGTAMNGGAAGGPSRSRITEWIAWWLQKPERDLDETEKSLMGVLDVTTAIALLRCLGTTPVLPFILNPLTVVLPLPRNLRIGSVRWFKVVLASFLLSCLHEAQRATVSAVCADLKARRLRRQKRELQNIVIAGDERKVRGSQPHSATFMDVTFEDEEQLSDEDDECLICAGGGTDPMSESISSLASTSSASLGQLEAFCVNAPQKHLMHRKCFLEWKDAYREQRAHHPQPAVTLLCEDQSLPVPGSTLWLRARAILAAAGLVRVEDMHTLPSRADTWMPSLRTIDESQEGESVLTLRNSERPRRDRRLSLSHTIARAARPRNSSVISRPLSFVCMSSAAESQASSSSSPSPEPKPNAVLASLVTKWPPCPGCRSAVKMNFIYAPPSPISCPSTSDPPHSSNSNTAKTRYTKLAKAAYRAFAQAWRELVTGRTILMKMLTQAMFAVFLLSMMRYKKKKYGSIMKGAPALIARLT